MDEILMLCPYCCSLLQQACIFTSHAHLPLHFQPSKLVQSVFRRQIQSSKNEAAVIYPVRASSLNTKKLGLFIIPGSASSELDDEKAMLAGLRYKHLACL